MMVLMTSYFLEIFSEFVASVFLPSSGISLASSAFAAASPSVGSNVRAAVIRAEILLDDLVALGGGFWAFNMIGVWLVL